MGETSPELTDDNGQTEPPEPANPEPIADRQIPHYVHDYYTWRSKWSPQPETVEDEQTQGVSMTEQFIRRAADRLPPAERRSWHRKLPKDAIQHGISVVGRSLGNIQDNSGAAGNIAVLRQTFYLEGLKRRALRHGAIFPEIPGAHVLEQRLTDYGDTEAAYTVKKLLAAYGASVNRIPRALLDGAYADMDRNVMGP